MMIRSGSSLGKNVIKFSKPIKLNLEYSRFNMFFDAQDNAQIIEEYRRIKRPLLDYAFSKGLRTGGCPNLLMVTSSVPGEGKTFTAINLALSIAMELDQTVLLVDADVVNPSLNRELNLGSYPGLNDYLERDTSSLSDYMLRTEIDNLKILPAGRKSFRSVELLSSKRMASLAEELSSRYSDRIVIFDSPPIMVTNEAPTLASLVGQVLVVVEAESTSKSVLKDALSQLEQDKPINLLLNKAKKKPGKYGYGYGYAGRN